MNRDKKIQIIPPQPIGIFQVAVEKLDKLVDIADELVASCAFVNSRAMQLKDSSLLQTNAHLVGLVEDLRDSLLKIHRIPIDFVFNRFERVVHERGAELGKDIALVITDGDIEVDKSVLEHLDDLLMPLVCNAMEHGIEAAQLRAERGKPVKGTITLNAYQDFEHIVIEVSDDGAGLNRGKILAKASDCGLLLQPVGTLNDKDIYGFIFDPGLSTAEDVSAISNRGAGMAAVKQTITVLRGTVDIKSIPGEGCTVQIRLPLALAIIDGFLVSIGHSFFVIPKDCIIECLDVPDISRYADSMDLRGKILPFIRLGALFNLKRGNNNHEQVVVINYASSKIGIIVDQLSNDCQTVIKPLGKIFSHIQGVSGSTVLDSGEIALVIDVPALIRHYKQRKQSLHNLRRHNSAPVL
ncbi:MAG: chemotaxis protein CheW [Methylococcales bacterium]|nr:chemotaxis protein CheW [Methylococcales bacterium]